METPIESVVRNFVADNFPYRQAGVALTDTTSFLEKGLIDSTGVLELVFFLENTFGIHMADNEILPDNLDSIECIATYIRRKLDNHPQPSADQLSPEKETTHAR